MLDIAKKEDCILDRISLLEKLAKDKKVIHVGCCDHIPLIQNKIKNKTWLHSILHNSSKRCVGIDINEDGINYLKDNLGYEDVLCGNIIEEEFNIIKEEHWDYMIIGEILEHVDNPCLFVITSYSIHYTKLYEEHLSGKQSTGPGVHIHSLTPLPAIRSRILPCFLTIS